jgi:hypothetical protein
MRSPRRSPIDDPRFSIRHEGFRNIGELAAAKRQPESCWTWA